VVICSLDPQSTFLDLIGPKSLPGTFLKDSAEAWKPDKWSYYTLHTVSKEMPKYKCDDPWADESFMTVVGFDSTDQIVEHWKNVMKGKLDHKLMGGHITCESYWDPHLVRKPGGHVSFFQMHAPYGIEGGWEKHNKEVEAAVLEKWHKAAPNMKKENIIMTLGETPEDIAIRFRTCGAVASSTATTLRCRSASTGPTSSAPRPRRPSEASTCAARPRIPVGWSPADRATSPPTRWPRTWASRNGGSQRS